MDDKKAGKTDVRDGYISQQELTLTHQLAQHIEIAEKQREIAILAQQKAHADLRAAEAELRAAQAEYNGTIMRLLWEYKLENSDAIRQSDGFIMKGDKNNESKENDASREGKKG